MAMPQSRITCRLGTATAGVIKAMVSLAEDAAAELESYARHIQDQQSHSAGFVSSALGKVRGLVPRLSLVLQYLRWAAEEGIAPARTGITSDALQNAIKLVTEYFIAMAQRVYGETGASSTDRAIEPWRAGSSKPMPPRSMFAISSAANVFQVSPPRQTSTEPVEP